MPRKERREVGTLLGTIFLASAVFGAMYWSAVFATEQDKAYSHAIRTIDILMEKAYGVAVTKNPE